MYELRMVRIYELYVFNYIRIFAFIRNSYILTSLIFYTRQLAIVGQFSKTNSAKIKLPHISSFASAFPTTPDNAGAEFRLFL